jgi:pyruvate kinase
VAEQTEFKRTKIIATVGPATNSYEAIRDLIAAGANGMRLNFSHATYEAATKQILWIRQASHELDKPVAIFQDLQGPKIRLGEVTDNHYEVKEGDVLHLRYGATHEGSVIPIQYDLSERVKLGERVFIYDGRIRTVATDVSEKTVTVRVENDGILMSRKGINLPDTDFSGAVLTEKDYADIDYGVDHDVDYVGLSFVHSAYDIELLRGYLAEKGSHAQIMAKIETNPAIQDDELEKIVEASDAVMVARGDLAVEVGAEIVPVVQRQIITLCQEHAKVSIVATQMMMSMVNEPEPTRAEVNDVSHAAVMGADCVMLSDETANGKYPIRTVETMKRILLYSQKHIPSHLLATPKYLKSHSGAISASAVHLSKELGVDAIVAETKTGVTAHHIAAYRPHLPVITVTSDPRVAQQLTLLYATKSFLRPEGEKAGMKLAQELVESGYLQRPATVVVVSGRQPGVEGGTDTIRIRTIE